MFTCTCKSIVNAQVVLLVGTALALLTTCHHFLCSSTSQKGRLPTFVVLCAALGGLWLCAVQTALVVRSAIKMSHTCYRESTSPSEANGSITLSLSYSSSSAKFSDCRVAACLVGLGSALALSQIVLPLILFFDYCRTRRIR